MEPSPPSQFTLPEPAPARPRRRRRFNLLKLLVVVVVVLFLVDVAPTPWALHMGGRFSLLETWDGYGPVQASNGGRYLLFTHLQGGLIGGGEDEPSCSGRGCDTLHGAAKLCTANGSTYSFTLSGAVHSWWSTDGARTSVDLTGQQLPDGWVVAFAGLWHGPVLQVADTDNSFTEVFTPAGVIRKVTSTADAGTANVTLQPGTPASFQAACRALGTGTR